MEQQRTAALRRRIGKAIAVAVALGAVGILGALAASRRSAGRESILLQRAYHVAASERPRLLQLLGEASRARRRAGLSPGRALSRSDGPGPLEVTWECGYRDTDALERERSPAAGSEEVRRADERVAQLGGPSDESVWQLSDGAPPSDGERFLGRNLYYARPETRAEVLAWRLHASEVRERLGVPRGRVWHRTAGPEHLPDVMWEVDYSAGNGAERHAREVELIQTAEFQGVMAHMRTLLRDFQMCSFQVSPG